MQVPAVAVATAHPPDILNHGVLARSLHPTSSRAERRGLGANRKHAEGERARAGS
jgi:hypothetical protein